MKFIGKLSVLPRLPEPIARLEELAYNLWWSWEPDARGLYATIDPSLWDAVNHNPVKLLRRVQQRKLDAAAQDPAFLQAYQSVLARFDAYMNADSTWFTATYPDKQDELIAYFSAEFGLHEALPIYSGGLGILSGDHCKAASDLGLPFVGVGFLYPQGYFTQHIDIEGRQQAQYEKIDLSEVPATPTLDQNGAPILIQVDMPGRTVYAKIWRIQVGRIAIYLMDTDVERNAPQDRELSARLYGGDRELRISQEVVLGIGGVRALRALQAAGIIEQAPTAWHMNEGHSAFLGLERARELVQGSGLSFDEAVEAVRADSLFTTHTPVPAGNDAFAFELVEKFFWQFWGQLGIDRDRFINFAKQDLDWAPQYSMTVLAIRMSAYQNGVSKLHGEVSRDMWKFLWPDTPAVQTPIGHITNGVHVKTWLAAELREFYARHLAPNWLDDVDDPNIWSAAQALPDSELWLVHQERKQKLVTLVRQRVARQFLQHGEGPQRIETAQELLNPDALTIGFARRFATYKRATLIFRDEERLQRLLSDPERPVQIVFSGKAHPADEPGKGLIQHIYQMSQRPEFWGKIVFVENYDMNIARHLISGVDVWLNNPRRPHEASGTSGQKAALSGIPNFSVLDGWWVEGYMGDAENHNGWSIGEERDYKDEDTQDQADVLHLYATLENEIIPLYFERNEAGVPEKWLTIMKNSIRTCTPQFSMQRMVKDYTNLYYLPAMQSGAEYHSEKFATARTMSAWKNHMRQSWGNVRIEAVPPKLLQVQTGQPIDLSARVWLNGTAQDEVALEIVAGQQNEQGELVDPTVAPMTAVSTQDGALVYRGQLQPADSGQLMVGIRVRPQNAHLINRYETGLNHWA